MKPSGKGRARWLALIGLCCGLSAGLRAQTWPAAVPAVLPSADVTAEPAQDDDVADQADVQAWRLQIDAPAPLDRLLRDYLDLSRFQAEAGQEGALPISRSELRRLVVSAPEQARALIEAEGYFSSVIKLSVQEGRAGEVVVVRLQLQPGPQTRIRQWQCVFEGALDTRLDQGDAPAMALAQSVREAWSLPAQAVFRQAQWADAKSALLARLRAQGYPLATLSGSAVTVDADAHLADLYVVADSGPSFEFGDIQVEGLVHQPASAVTNLAPFKKGDPYKEKQLLDWQERIQKLNVFERLFVNADQQASGTESVVQAPILVQVKEWPLQSATLGGGFSSDTGPRVSGEYLHRNLWGLDWQAKVKAQLGRDESNGQVDFTSHPWPGQTRGLVSLQAGRVIDSLRTSTSNQRVRVGLLHEDERVERTDYVEFQSAVVRAQDSMVVSDASALSGTRQWIERAVDNVVLPTKGQTTLAQLSAGRTYSALNKVGFFERGYVRSTWYRPLPSQWHASLRLEGGQVLARSSVSVPDTLLFRAGGDESVRGYAYRTLGVLSDGVVIGGRALATGSVELAHPVSQSLPSLWGAVFVDAGDAAASVSALRPKTGYGVGLRWRSPVGPLKLDAAYGTQVQRWRLHFSLGVTL